MPVVKFEIECTVERRWVRALRAMLEHMEQMGEEGKSRDVTFFADGGADFKPKFRFPSKLPKGAPPVSDNDGDAYFDAGPE